LTLVGDFKLKLAGFFALLALLPLAIAFYGYNALAHDGERGRADARLDAGLRSVVAVYASRLDAAASQAESLAAHPALGRALRGRDRRTLVRLVRTVPHAAVRAPGLSIGPVPSGAATKTVRVLDHGRTLGRVVVSVPFDAGLLRTLRSGLADADRLAVLRSDRLGLVPGTPAQVTLDGTSYRGLASAPLADPKGVELAVLTPQAGISHAARVTEERIAVALLASLLLIAAGTYLVGRSIVRSLGRVAAAARAIAGGRLGERVEVRGSDEFAQLGAAFNHMAAQLEQRLAELEAERARVREVAARFGEALAATHAPEQLLQLVVESVVEATGAAGGVVVSLDGTRARAGDPDATGDTIRFPLRTGDSDFGTLELVGEEFDTQRVETAAALTAQAVVALENARLHRVVERQALVDGLTGLANRRSLDETLHAEVSRAVRFGEQVCLVLCDLDNFKSVNDRFGHPCGDLVLRSFAQTLGETVRDIDTAGRWGGEEFAVVLPGTDLAGGTQLAERVRQAIEIRELAAEDGSPLPVTASFGVAVFPQTGSLEGLIAAADGALYEAKRTGKNRVVAAAEGIPADSESIV
jgi:diguanylate cyclase (GGDEF)-like protein